jgi:ribonuclease P protein component
VLETAGGKQGVAGIEVIEDLGFRSEHRLHAAAEFSQVFAARRVIRGKCFDLHYLAVKPESRETSVTVCSARLGLVMAKKLARRSVQRNMLKRLAREAFRHARSHLPPYDLVLRLARPPGNSLGAEARKAWRADVEHLLERLSQLPLPR